MITILTRFGIGQQAGSFYKKNIPLLKKVFLNSLQLSTYKRFQVVFIIDIRTPDWVVEQIEAAVDGSFEIRFWKHDPFSNFSLKPDGHQLLSHLGYADGDFAYTLRIDADDALGTHFLSELIEVMEGERARGYDLVAVNPVFGAHGWPESGNAFELYKADYSVQALGAIVASDSPYIFDFSHKRLGEEVSSLGGKALVLRGSLPHWFRSLHEGSDTNRRVIRLAASVPCLNHVRNLIYYAFGMRHRSHWGKRLRPKDLQSHFNITTWPISAEHCDLKLKPTPNVCDNVQLFGKTRLNRKEEILLIAQKQVSCDSKFINSCKELFYSF